MNSRPLSPCLRQRRLRRRNGGTAGGDRSEARPARPVTSLRPSSLSHRFLPVTLSRLCCLFSSRVLWRNAALCSALLPSPPRGSLPCRCAAAHTDTRTPDSLADKHEQRAQTWREHSDVRKSATIHTQTQTGQRRRTAAVAVFPRLTAHLLCLLRFDSQASVVLSAPSSSRQEEMSAST